MSELTISRYGGTITVASESEPANPVLTYTNIGVSWARRGNNTGGTPTGNVITVDENTGANDRSFSFTVTSTTQQNSSYLGTASASSAYTVTQSGTGSTPTPSGYTLQIVNRTSHQISGNIAGLSTPDSFSIDAYQTENRYDNLPETLTLFALVGETGYQSKDLLVYVENVSGVVKLSYQNGYNCWFQDQTMTPPTGYASTLEVPAPTGTLPTKLILEFAN